mmetsp:Transcript_8972/g.31679  ORF Transcript_8972/g.31679 Transcript_8972/m.31679 type:complete len:291 (+) Transcript_8972:3138-4010(+)
MARQRRHTHPMRATSPTDSPAVHRRNHLLLVSTSSVSSRKARSLRMRLPARGPTTIQPSPSSVGDGGAGDEGGAGDDGAAGRAGVTHQSAMAACRRRHTATAASVSPTRLSMAPAMWPSVLELFNSIHTQSCKAASEPSPCAVTSAASIALRNSGGRSAPSGSGRSLAVAHARFAARSADELDRRRVPELGLSPPPPAPPAVAAGAPRLCGLSVSSSPSPRHSSSSDSSPPSPTSTLTSRLTRRRMRARIAAARCAAIAAAAAARLDASRSSCSSSDASPGTSSAPIVAK